MIIRAVTPADEQGLLALAGHLDTVNLPSDPQAVRGIIAASTAAFAGLLDGVRDPRAQYTLVAEDEGRLLGTASIFACHGTLEDPHYYLSVVNEVRHSQQLGMDRPRTLLRLGRDTDPWSELGGLVVHPEARGRGIGRLLVAARLLLMAMHPSRFSDRVLAELLPPRRTDGGNAFWDAVGGPLTGLDYYRADLLCRSDKEFIEAFFPDDHLVAELLPPPARELIGVEGPATTPVRHLLHRAGFHWLGTIDPFDAGPHDGAAVADIVPIRRSRACVMLDLPPEGVEGRSVIFAGNPAQQRFAAVSAQQVGEGLRLDAEASAALMVKAGDRVWAMPLDW